MNLTKPILSVLLVAVLAFFAARAYAQGPDGAKLDKIILQQEQIIKELLALKEEVRIVKIRASSGG